MDIKSIAAVVAFVIAWINVYMDKQGLPLIPEAAGENTAEVIAFIVTVWTTYQNNRKRKEDK